MKHPFPAIAAVVATALLACEEKKPAPRPQPPPTVVVSAASTADVPIYRDYPATAMSIQPVSIVPRVEGWLLEQNFVNGAMVDAGQKLYQIDPDPFKAKLDAAEADLAVANAQLFNAKQQYERNKPLLDSDAVSQEKLESLEASYLAAQAQVQSAQAEIEIAKLNLSYCTIASPVAGQVSATAKYVGDLVRSQEQAALVTIQPLDPIWVQFMAVSSDLEALRSQFGSETPGVEVSLPEGSWTRTGKVVFIDNSVVPGSSMIMVRVEVPNPDHAILPGTYLNAKFRQSLDEGAVIVPIDAVVRQAAQSVIWVVDSQDAATMKTVSLGARFGGDVVVTSGISAGEQVVVQGQTNLRNGAKVEVLTPHKYSKPSAPPAAKPATAAPAAADGKTSSAPVERPTVAAGTLEADPIS
ncbi:MAG: efflux RND transporter periplasmic adaptor subunit [Phycisphaerales bacterium]